MIILIYSYIDKFLWKLITTILVVILDSCNYMVRYEQSQKSKGNSHFYLMKILHIIVQSLVKIYERENRWTREWKAGARIRKRLGLEKAVSVHGRI